MKENDSTKEEKAGAYLDVMLENTDLKVLLNNPGVIATLEKAMIDSVWQEGETIRLEVKLNIAVKPRIYH